MKSRRRHSSSEESAGSGDSADSESEVSSGSGASDSEPARRHKKHKRRAASSDSGSEEVHRRSKKRKHKKKKKKHGKKRRHDDSDDSSDSSDEEQKRKHKHRSDKSKRRRSDSGSPSVEEVPVVYSRGDSGGRASAVRVSSERSLSREPQPAARYYDYRQASPRRSSSEHRRRSPRQEAERFYRGSSKERTHRYRPQSSERYEPERAVRQERHREYEERPRREDYQGYAHRSVKYEQHEDYRQRPHRDREYNPRAEFPRNTRGPVCLVCNESHSGRPCRAPAPRRNREYDDDRRAPAHRVERYERPRPEREEHRRTSRERGFEPERPRSKHSGGGEPAPRPSSAERRPREGMERRPREGGERGAGDDDRRRERKSRFAEDDGKNYSWGKTEVKSEAAPAEKDKPNFGLSGKLAADTNTVNGIVLKYSEPADAKQPKRRWRFYPFKGDKALPILYIHRQSCFILGREHRAVDIPLEHPSVSKQHAALQYRATPFTRPDGSQARRVRPYIIDLDSANGTFVNNKKIEPRRFVELLERDVVKFGFSQREYVLLHENSKDDAADDDQEMGGEAATGTGVTSIATVKRERQMKQEAEHDGE